jgi:hypothetical protein
MPTRQEQERSQEIQTSGKQGQQGDEAPDELLYIFVKRL